ncbi:MAG: hypothetical protein R6W68_12155 [Ignavibacteriaceae bacterium]
MKLFVFIFFLLITITACDLFMTREAEPPDQSRANFQVATEPEIVISNLTNSFHDKNVQNYISCFIDSSFSEKRFLFQPSGEVVTQYPFLNQDWDLADEQRYFNSVTSSVQTDFPLSLTFTDESFTRSGDSVVFSATYFINIPVSEPEASNYQGNIQFYMLNDDRSIWVIYYWQDIKLPDLPSWSELKGKYY